MPYFVQEKLRLQAEVQADTAKLAAQQQALSAAQARLVQAQAQIPPLRAAADAADQRVADVNQAIAEHPENEPDRFIEQGGNKPPRPNPAWIAWNRAGDQLRAALDQARVDANAAHGRLGAGQAVVAQAQGEVQAATAALQATQAAITAAQQRLADVERWQTEIARDPLDRAALERAAAELSTQTMAVEEALTVAQFQQEEAEQRLASLVARRDQLIPMLNEVSGQLPAAEAERQAAQAVLLAALEDIRSHVEQGP
jgi:chromosome segregation ATPase